MQIGSRMWNISVRISVRILFRKFS